MQRVGNTTDGTPFDLVITNISQYTAWRNTESSVTGRYLTLNMALNTNATLEFAFVESGSYVPVTLPKFRFDVFDIDQGPDGKARESITFFDASLDAVLTPDTNVRLEKTESSTTFASSQAGTGADNPYSPNILTRQSAQALP